ncbi:thiamine pyrophosphate-dependent enzyme, partial [Enterobacter hormaechei]
IHSLAGAIGMGLPMANGPPIANPHPHVVGVVGDGGLSLKLGELATLAQEKANVTLLVMKHRGYGVLRGIKAVSYKQLRAHHTGVIIWYSVLWLKKTGGGG